MLFVSVIIMCVVELLQFKFQGIQGRLPFYKEYFREATFYEGQSRISETNFT